jgi:hypothetical protein
MKRLRQAIGVLGALALLVGVGTAFAAGGRPDVSGTSASDVTASTAVLKATVHPKGAATTFQFEYGTSEAYGVQTLAGQLPADGSAQPVSVAVSGLAPGTTYHFRVVASNDNGITRGPDKTFTTLGTPPGADPGDPPLQDPASAAPTPDLGSSVLIAPTAGELRVRRPGRSRFVPLELGAELPTGTEVDARAGTIALTAALPSGATQTGHFGGGRFQLRQDRRGYVDLYLRGRYCTRASGSAVASAAANKRPGRRLWGRDKGGRFRTHGHNSQTTVRGTRWLVADTCKGTLTRVTHGSVVVRDLVRGKSVLVKAGGRYLAKPRRR